MNFIEKLFEDIGSFLNSESDSKKEILQLLFKNAGEKQKVILFELYQTGQISYNRESGYFERGALSHKSAKALLNKKDKTLQQKIDDLEPYIIRNEEEAKKLNIKLGGGARYVLNELYELKKLAYTQNVFS